MTNKNWKNLIIAQTASLGTYRKEFDSAIDALANILEKRDAAEDQYKESGAMPMIEHTNSHGETNWAKNPALQIWCDLNTQALAYWRDLGLTPAGLKKINEKALQPKKSGGIAELLAKIEKES